jgi:hypothetical protein
MSLIVRESHKKLFSFFKCLKKQHGSACQWQPPLDEYGPRKSQTVDGKAKNKPGSLMTSLSWHSLCLSGCSLQITAEQDRWSDSTHDNYQ